MCVVCGFCFFNSTGVLFFFFPRLEFKKKKKIAARKSLPENRWLKKQAPVTVSDSCQRLYRGRKSGKNGGPQGGPRGEERAEDRGSRTPGPGGRPGPGGGEKKFPGAEHSFQFPPPAPWTPPDAWVLAGGGSGFPTLTPDKLSTQKPDRFRSSPASGQNWSAYSNLASELRFRPTIAS